MKAAALRDDARRRIEQIGHKDRYWVPGIARQGECSR